MPTGDAGVSPAGCPQETYPLSRRGRLLTRTKHALSITTIPTIATIATIETIKNNQSNNPI